MKPRQVVRAQQRNLSHLKEDGRNGSREIPAGRTVSGDEVIVNKMRTSIFFFFLVKKSESQTRGIKINLSKNSGETTIIGDEMQKWGGRSCLL